jgi:hypothetical protein
MRITKNTGISIKAQSTAINHAINFLKRDFHKVFGCEYKDAEDIVIDFDDSIKTPEMYQITVSEDKMQVKCADELAVIYAIIHITREYLGVEDFWYWCEKEPEKKEYVDVENTIYTSAVAKVRYRGWFVNDEVCLIGWSTTYPPEKAVWEIVFETLLRCGGNMVIPGTDLPRSGGHFELASEMGLYITHHHAEPLGAEMFLRAYPDKEASFDTNGELFEVLWDESIEKFKDRKIVWTLGFRGQGDAPFWMNDPKYITPESRGKVIRKVIDRQYEMICSKVKDPICAVYLYGEITELYMGGFLDLPDHYIKIWSDNGYGKMVTRRNGTHDPRTKALPDKPGKHGLYYHVTFHDLQASSHLTLLSNPSEMVEEELEKAFHEGADDYLLLNCGNIRPHVYLLEVVSHMWKFGKADTSKLHEDFIERYLGGNVEAGECYRDYFKACVQYGKYDDNKTGDEFYYHTTRRLCTDVMAGKDRCKGLFFFAPDMDLSSQVAKIKSLAFESIQNFEKLASKCDKVYEDIKDIPFFYDNIRFQTYIHLYGAKGLYELCCGLDEYEKEDYPKSFIHLTDAIHYFDKGVELLREGEQGKWKDFYRCDWLTNVSASSYAVDSLRRYVRMISDGPDLFAWHKRICMPVTERNIYLENTQRETLSDDALAEKMRKFLGM